MSLYVTFVHMQAGAKAQRYEVVYFQLLFTRKKKSLDCYYCLQLFSESLTD